MMISPWYGYVYERSRSIMISPLIACRCVTHTRMRTPRHQFMWPEPSKAIRTVYADTKCVLLFDHMNTNNTDFCMGTRIRNMIA